MLAGRPLRAAIVDLDGTMVDTLGDFLVALRGMLGELGLGDVSPEQVAQRVGKGSEHLIAQVLRLHLEPSQADALHARALAIYQQHYTRVNGSHASVFPGVSEGLQRLRDAGLVLACVTNKPGAHARELLARKNLLEHFAQVAGGDAFERRKPDPLPLLRTCEALGVEPAQVLMIGDSRNDAEAAAAAGCPAALATYGYNHGEPIQDSRALVFFDRLDQLPLQ
ncbi:MAG: phosphoglycolate phosphatase [Betaproteobacteria bacterium]|nr:phosphoglycolate phosphatase [Betaproteobacteria bacterium]